MSFVNTYEKWFRRLLPAPFVIALLLSILTVVLALIFGRIDGDSVSLKEVALQWESGLWSNGLLVFAFQMMFMLVLGHSLALSKPFSWLIHRLLAYCKDTSSAAIVVAMFAILVGFLNWGLALIFGAILSRKVAEHFQAKNQQLNYPLIGACGYLGLMVWHGGLSGSSLLKVNEPGHLKSLTNSMGVNLPESISISETVFSSMNVACWLLLFLLLPLFAWFIGKKVGNGQVPVLKTNSIQEEYEGKQEGIERITFSNWFGKFIGLAVILVAVMKAISFSGSFLEMFTPNFINLCLLGLALTLHRSIGVFLGAVGDAIAGAAGILLQFPLYFGIMAVMVQSNLVGQFSAALVAISTETTYPLLTFLSAALVNVFVPSGGGQWAIQGPIILESYLQSGIPLQKSIMAMAYGDQLTNMMQPFWALPLLGITGLKAKQIIPFCLLFMLLGAVIFLSVLMLF